MEEKAEMLLKSAAERRRLGDAAYETILREWNAETAADRLVEIAGKLLGAGRRGVIQNVEELAYKEGALSTAEVISPRKMYRYLMSVSEKAGADRRRK